MIFVCETLSTNDTICVFLVNELLSKKFVSLKKKIFDTNDRCGKKMNPIKELYVLNLSSHIKKIIALISSIAHYIQTMYYDRRNSLENKLNK